MFAKEAIDNFLNGKMGVIFPREMMDRFEGMRVNSGAGEANIKQSWNQGAKAGDTIIEVTITLREMENEEVE
jgi:predicted RNA-binding Zn ribbon-like protein